MRTSVLIPRLGRLIETEGASEEGAKLAELYAAAVEKANRRLEAVVAAADAKSIGDALRLMSEEPPLLEEVSALDFRQLSDWENLCAMKDWTSPPHIDRMLMERVATIGETKDAIAPLLTLYKKAVRVDNVRLAVKSLRQLAKIDHSQDWSRNLKQAEKRLQNALVADFRAARKASQDDVCEKIEQELLDGAWQDGLTADGVDEVAASRTRREAARREVEGSENIALLRTCRDEKWNRKQALALLQSIDGLVAKGWTLPREAKDVVDDCRVRCAREIDDEEKEAQWRDACEQLHVATQKEDCAAIRDALAATAFLDREPPEDMFAQAHDILNHAESAQRRRTLLHVGVSVAALVAVLALSSWWLRAKMFDDRCADEVEILSRLEAQAKAKPQAAIEGLTSILKRLKAEAPAVYAVPEVAQFEARLKNLIAANATRTNQIAQLFVELEAFQTRGWTNGVEAASVTNRFNQVNALLVQDDAAFRARYRTLKDAWLDVQAKEEADRRGRADTFRATLASHLKTVAQRLRTELARAELRNEETDCLAALEEWKTLHSAYADDADTRLIEAEQAFNAARERQRAYTNLLETLTQTYDVEKFLALRHDLIETYGDYPEVKHLKPLAVGAATVKTVLAGPTEALKAYLDTLGGRPSQSAFEEFLKENVLVIAEAPEYYSLYGLADRHDQLYKINAVSRGKPDIERPSYANEWKISCGNGAILSFYQKALKDYLTSPQPVDAFLMPSSDEIRSVVELAKQTKVTATRFEDRILELIDRHLAYCHTTDFVKTEEKFVEYYNPIKGWMSPYRRVQYLAWYMRWLKEDLKIMPNVHDVARWYDELDQLAQSVTVDGVDDSLSWLCIWDDRVRRRMRECITLLNRMPRDWVDRYRKAKSTARALGTVGDWTVSVAGKVKFDPLDPNFAKDPDGLYVSAPNVANDHPLYALRSVNGWLMLVRAFEPGKTSTWRKCGAMERTAEGYVLGEPLYHVSARGAFIDVQAELRALAAQAGLKADDPQLTRIPLFTKGGR